MNNVQRTIEKTRAVWETLDRPLLSQFAEIYGLSIRDFAGIFSISKGHAEDILKHRKFPTLELAFRISRYFEVTVEDLFGWRIDDTGDRCPNVRLDYSGQLVRATKDSEGDLRKVFRDLSQKYRTEAWGTEE